MLRKHQCKVKFSSKYLLLGIQVQCPCIQSPAHSPNQAESFICLPTIFLLPSAVPKSLSQSSTYILKKVENNQNTSFHIKCPDRTPQKRVLTAHQIKALAHPESFCLHKLPKYYNSVTLNVAHFLTKNYTFKKTVLNQRK